MVGMAVVTDLLSVEKIVNWCLKSGSDALLDFHVHQSWIGQVIARHDVLSGIQVAQR